MDKFQISASNITKLEFEVICHSDWHSVSQNCHAATVHAISLHYTVDIYDPSFIRRLCNQPRGCDRCTTSFWRNNAPELELLKDDTIGQGELTMTTTTMASAPTASTPSYAAWASFLSSVANGSLHANSPVPYRDGRRTMVRLSCLTVEHQWFALLGSYG